MQLNPTAEIQLWHNTDFIELQPRARCGDSGGFLPGTSGRKKEDLHLGICLSGVALLAGCHVLPQEKGWNCRRGGGGTCQTHRSSG